VVAHCGPGEVLGEMGLLTQQTRTATVVAETSASVRRLDGQMVREELDRMAPWLRTLVKNLAVRIRRDVEAER
jgi:CRP-like cAMP-binding protein